MTAADRQEAETENGASDKSGPRRMLNEKQVLALIPDQQNHVIQDDEGRTLSEGNPHFSEPTVLV